MDDISDSRSDSCLNIGTICKMGLAEKQQQVIAAASCVPDGSKHVFPTIANFVSDSVVPPPPLAPKCAEPFEELGSEISPLYEVGYLSILVGALALLVAASRAKQRLI
jgi:hypothetical protein